MEIFQEELRCIQNFLYFFMEKEEYFNNKTLKNKVKNIIYKFELEKNIVPLVYDSSVNEWDLRVLAIQILINATNTNKSQNQKWNKYPYPDFCK